MSGVTVQAQLQKKPAGGTSCDSSETEGEAFAVPEKAKETEREALAGSEKASETVAKESDGEQDSQETLVWGPQQEGSQSSVLGHGPKKGIIHLSEAEFSKWVAEETAAQEANIRRMQGGSQSARPR